jgi:O-antigen ligase
MKPDGSPLGSPPLLYPILLAYLLGVALASHLNLPRPTLLAIMVALFLCVFLSMARSKKATSTLFWMGAFFWFGILTLQVQLNPPFQDNHVVYFTGRKRVVVRVS